MLKPIVGAHPEKPRLGAQHHALLSRTLMRPPVVKGQSYPVSGFLRFFRLVAASIGGQRQRVLTWFPMQVPQRGCTTPVLRFARHVHDACSNHAGCLLRPRNLSVPSYRPHHRQEERVPVLP